LQPLARIGANITGIDAGQNMIDTARSHAREDPSISDSITYICGTIEDHANKHKESYDAVVTSEVLEHVLHKDVFLSACVASLKVRSHSIIIIIIIIIVVVVVFVVVVVVVVIVIIIFLLFLGRGMEGERGTTKVRELHP